MCLLLSTCLTNATPQGFPSGHDGRCLAHFTGSARNATKHRPTRHINGGPGRLETNINAINSFILNNNQISPRINYHIIIPKLFKILINRLKQGKYRFLTIFAHVYSFYGEVFTREICFSPSDDSLRWRSLMRNMCFGENPPFIENSPV